MRLCSNLSKNQNYKVYFNNFFTSLRLFKKLKNDGIQALEIIRPNRMEGAKNLLVSEKEFKSKGQGSCKWRADHGTGTTVIC